MIGNLLRLKEAVLVEAILSQGGHFYYHGQCDNVYGVSMA